MKRVCFALSLLIMNTAFSGCSVFMAAHQPDYKDLSFLKKGVERNAIILQLGEPVLTDKDKSGNKIDFFQFRQGYGMGNKTARMVFHGAADVFSLGLWEVVGTPSEAICNGHPVSIKIIYDENDNADEIIYLKAKQ